MVVFRTLHAGNRHYAKGQRWRREPPHDAGSERDELAEKLERVYTNGVAASGIAGLDRGKRPADRYMGLTTKVRTTHYIKIGEGRGHRRCPKGCHLFDCVPC
jgi:hypothetical protein